MLYPKGGKVRKILDKIKEFIRILGPGMIFTALAVGQTHFALMPFAGAAYGMSFLWIIVLVHLVFYPVYEYGARYGAATGKSLLHGYLKSPLGRAPLVFFLITGSVVAPLYFASWVGLSASVLTAAFPGINFTIWAILLFLVSLGLVLGGGYKPVERICTILMFVIVAMSIIAFVISPPSLGETVSGLVPAIPAAAAGVVAPLFLLSSILRLPTGPETSIFLSEWGLKKQKEWREKGQSGADLLRDSLTDFRAGWIMSIFISICLMGVGASVLEPAGIVPEGVEVSLKIGEIFTETIGAWIFPIFIITIFAAFWGSYLSGIDGVLRFITDIWRKTFNLSEKWAKRIGTVSIIIYVFAGLLMATILQEPMVMALLAVASSFVFFPLIFGLNIYCATRLVDEEFQPGTLNIIIAIAGFCVSLVGLGLLFYVRVLPMLA